MVICDDFINYKVFDFEDELNVEDVELRYKPVTKFDRNKLLIGASDITGSVNGLLFLPPLGYKPYDYYCICNPITREYIDFPNKGPQSDGHFDGLVNYGFGVSKTSGGYKGVRIVQQCVRHPSTYKVSRIKKSICHVYTIGTGKWRKIASCEPLGNEHYSNGAFLNGSLHWFVEDFMGSHCIMCFDLETETYTTFSPPSLLSDRETGLQVLVALGDHLCLSDSAYADEVVLWLMKEYGDEKSWTKEFVIRKSPLFVNVYRHQSSELVYPIKVFKDGDVLMLVHGFKMVYYSNKTKTTTQIDAFGRFDGCTPIQAMLHTPSFLSLKSFPKEDVSSFVFFDQRW